MAIGMCIARHRERFRLRFIPDIFVCSCNFFFYFGSGSQIKIYDHVFTHGNVLSGRKTPRREILPLRSRPASDKEIGCDRRRHDFDATVLGF